MSPFFATHRSVRTVMTVLTCLTLAMLTVPTAFAASSTGAEHHSLLHCDAHETVVTCYTLEAVVTATNTPSGNAIYTGSSRGTATVTDRDGNVLAEQSNMNQFHSLEKDELLSVLGNQGRATITLADGTTCTSSFSYHLVNGQIQFDRVEFECS
jgi:hypothetical protein